MRNLRCLSLKLVAIQCKFSEEKVTLNLCRSYEDCCGSRCCVRALSIQRLWYFWFLLMMGVLFCCGAGFFIRRRMYPPPLVEEPTFNVSYTRQPVNTAS
ncbi:PREDICTED: vesicular, overexpressed in cancer, prosurvival protein 1-like, partial [Eurypyga helias]|uniref:vesicular, overexpressed in cancer, prosurvival protein 1-like n=1 Tax=Eurypyga helias TaxID=54383 RepID=UPI00052848AE